MSRAMLMILDGWGIGEPGPGNAIHLADTPNMDRLTQTCPHTQLEAHGLAVGLPDGQMGNSEVGHLNIGAGRIVYQDLTMINLQISDGEFFKNPAIVEAVDLALKNGTALHLMGLVSDGGVHSHYDHLVALLKLCKKKSLEKVFIHAFLDGRDVPPKAAKADMERLQSACREIGVGKIATVSGRYYAMDRDRRWDRVEKAYDSMVLGEGIQITDPCVYIQESYDSGITDEFVVPAVVMEGHSPTSVIEDGDAAIFFNFRPDRARQIVRALTEPEFDGFQRKKTASTFFVTMTEYDATLRYVHVAYPPEEITNTLGQVIAERDLKQLRIAETEKYAHVTFFFNGGVETPNPLEERLLIPSPQVATYDLKPEMAAYEVRDRVIAEIAEENYDLIILNFANCDMVGHTGVLDAEISAVETVDSCIGSIVEATQAHGYDLLITADHGNGEKMIDDVTEEPFTAHTTNPVPLILVSDRPFELREGKLSDIAPTVLMLMDIEQPGEMTGHSLLLSKGEK